MVVAPNEPRLLALTLGALRAGILPVLVGPSLAPRERQEIVDDAQPVLSVSDLDQVSWDHPPARDLAALPLGRPILYTSGTTGRPKGVWGGVLSEDLAAEWAADEAELWAPRPGTEVLVCSPLYHSAGHRLATSALVAGARVLLAERFDPVAVTRLLAERDVSVTFLVPTHLRRLLADGEPPRPRALRRALHAGEPCPPDLKRRAMEWLAPGSLWEFYGATEGQFTAISPEEWLQRPGSVGRARPGRHLTIANPDAGGVGEVFVSAPEFARWEYWRDPGRTASAWNGDSFTAGDLGSVDDAGYLTLASRREDLIISGGVNVYPAVVERILLEHEAVTEAAVFGVPDDRWGQRVCAAVVADERAREDIGAWTRTRLLSAQRPKDLLVLDELPTLPTGKLDRGALRDRV